MKKLEHKDKNKRKTVNILELSKTILKSISTNFNFSKFIKYNATISLTKLPINSSNIRTVNFCIITKRRKKISKKYHFSRLTFLRLARNGNVSGLTKSSW